MGRTADVDNRLAWHNDGPCGYTRQHRPWWPIVVIEFPDESTAVRFGVRTVHLDGCVEVDAAYYGTPPGWIGRRVDVQ